MRGAILDSLRLSPTPAAEVAYPKGAIVVCVRCGLPLYRLIGTLYLGEPAARSSWKYQPVSLADLHEIETRADLEPGQRAAVKALSPEARRAHCDAVLPLHPGDAMDCPSCRQAFALARTSAASDGGASEFHDRGYTISLAVIPPVGAARRVRSV